ncbi:MAG: glycosyltransferase family 2 protein [Usitatibacter sp.]
MPECESGAPSRAGIDGGPMIDGRKLVVVMPAYNAAGTLELTFNDMPKGLVDEVILVDDRSRDETLEVAKRLGITKLHVHAENRGYGANQKTCYQAALAENADIVVMLHPDYQYEPKLLTAMAGMVASGVYGVVLGSRILGSGPGGALAGGMPAWKYVANRALTALQNLLTGAKLSEYHTGYRAFSREALLALPLLANSDDFVFDNQMLVQAIAQGIAIGEISCPTRYRDDSSSISFARSVRYGFGVLGASIAYRAWRWGIARPAFLDFRSGGFLVAPGTREEDPIPG